MNRITSEFWGKREKRTRGSIWWFSVRNSPQLVSFTSFSSFFISEPISTWKQSGLYSGIHDSIWRCLGLFIWYDLTCYKPEQSAHLLPPQPAGLGWTSQEWQPRLFPQSPDDVGVAKDEISINTFVVKKVFFHLKRFLTDRDVGRVGKTSHFEFNRLLTIGVNQRYIISSPLWQNIIYFKDFKFTSSSLTLRISSLPVEECSTWRWSSFHPASSPENVQNHKIVPTILPYQI